MEDHNKLVLIGLQARLSMRPGKIVVRAGADE
jgi:hypothetical protein